jgi:uracil phosphoribosyltransferase
MIKYLSQSNSIANVFIRELRDSGIQKDQSRFRKNLIRLGEIFAYEISKTFDYSEHRIETPLGYANAFLPDDEVVLATIMRAGLPMHQGMLNYFNDAESAFVSAYRKHHKDGTFEINLEYVNCPNLDGKTLILTDPMIATGSSVEAALKALEESGTPKEIHIVTVIASTYGLGYIKRICPGTHIWLGEEDEELTAKSYIVPGLGDAGDLAFGGTKPD